MLTAYNPRWRTLGVIESWTFLFGPTLASSYWQLYHPCALSSPSYDFHGKVLSLCRGSSSLSRRSARPQCVEVDENDEHQKRREKNRLRQKNIMNGSALSSTTRGTAHTTLKSLSRPPHLTSPLIKERPLVSVLIAFIQVPSTHGPACLFHVQHCRESYHSLHRMRL